jgi:hypothetical protein
MYRVIRLDTERNTAKMSAVVAAMNSKPASFFKDGVRHLFIDTSSDSLDKDEAITLLRLCENVINLVLLGDVVGPILLPILARMPLRRLSIDLEELFGRPQAVNFHHPLFLSLTHLDIFGTLVPSVYTHLVALPALTHLCLNGHIKWDIFRFCLSECKSLVVLVNFWPMSRELEAYGFCAYAPLEDARFVVGCPEHYGWSWEAGAHGWADFWIEAENFVARKRGGENQGARLVLFVTTHHRLIPSSKIGSNYFYSLFAEVSSHGFNR